MSVRAAGLALVLLFAGCTGQTAPQRPPAAVRVLNGTIAAAPYVAEVPAGWNGTLVLYSHGYVAPGASSPAQDASDRLTARWLLDHGYALAGSGYRSSGWAVADAVEDQLAVVDELKRRAGVPRRVIAWGHSMGGLVAAQLVQRRPDLFGGGLPMCGVVAGGGPAWDSGLDGAFAFHTLLGSGLPLQLVHISQPDANLALATQALDRALVSPLGRARVSLAAAIAGIPGWFDASAAPPATPNLQLVAQAQWERTAALPFAFAYRAELEHRGGGNPSGNVGVDYGRLLAASPSAAEVTALYAESGGGLDQDLARLAAAQRIEADPIAAEWLRRTSSLSPQPPIPVVTLHGTDDGLVVVQQESAYAPERRLFVRRPGHCSFSPAEMLAAFQALVRRLDSGSWSDISPTALDAAALALGPDYNGLRSLKAPVDGGRPQFVEFRPPVFLRTV